MMEVKLCAKCSEFIDQAIEDMPTDGKCEFCGNHLTVYPMVIYEDTTDYDVIAKDEGRFAPVMHY